MVVTELPATIGKDILEIYFESPHAGDDLEDVSVELSADKQMAVVTFKTVDGTYIQIYTLLTIYFQNIF